MPQHESQPPAPDAPAFPGPHTVDPELFDACGSDVRSFERTIEVNALPADVFRFWTDAGEWARVYGRPGISAQIDLAIGGRYEWYFVPATETTPALGSNGCQILSYIPGRMVSFTWNAPPTQPESRAKRTWVVVELEPLDDGTRTRCRLTHLGFGDASHWDETHAYFADAWSTVLTTMKAGLERTSAS